MLKHARDSLARATKLGPRFETFPPFVDVVPLPACPCCCGRGFLLPKPDAGVLVAAIVGAGAGSSIFNITELQRHAENNGRQASRRHSLATQR